MAAPINIHSREFWTNYVRTAEAEACKILGRNVNEDTWQRDQAAHRIDARQRPTIANFDRIVPPNFWIWNQGSSAAPAPRQNREERAESQAQQAAVIGSIFAIAGAFLAAYTYKGFIRQSEAYQRSHEVNAAIQHWPRGDALLDDIRQLSWIQVRIDELNSDRIQHYTISSFTLLAGGLTLAAGGFAAIPVLMTIGKIVLFLSTLMFVTTLGWHRNDNAEIRRHCEEIVDRRTINLYNHDNGHFEHAAVGLQTPTCNPTRRTRAPVNLLMHLSQFC